MRGPESGGSFLTGPKSGGSFLRGPESGGSFSRGTESWEQALQVDWKVRGQTLKEDLRVGGQAAGDDG